MDKRKPGVFDTLRQMAGEVSKAFEPLLDAFYGVTFRRSVHVPRGSIVRLDDETVGRTIVMHPLDSIAAEFPRDYNTQSLEVGLYFADWACRRLDEVLENIDDMVTSQTTWQDIRMAQWMRDNGVTAEDLEQAQWGADLARIKRQFDSGIADWIDRVDELRARL